MGTFPLVVNLQYEELAQRLRIAMIWIDSPERTKTEIAQRFGAYKILFDEVTRLERLMRNGNE